MTWSRFDDAASTHPKARVAGNEAWSLWVAAVMYCNRYLTDGFVPLAALAAECLPFPISAAKAKKLAEALCEARIRPGAPGLFEPAEGGYVIHDFLAWNPSKAEVESRRKADRDRKRGAKDSAPDSGTTPPRIPSGNQPGKRSDSAPHTIPAVPAQPVGEENPPSPLPVVTEVRRRDPMALNRDRADVRELFEAWRVSFGREGATLRLGWGSGDGDTLAECIDAHGLPDCLLVAKHAPNDGMVSGRDDDKKTRHESIRYIFGNEETFSRILRDARKAAAKNSGLSPIEKIRRAGELQ